MVEIEFEYFQGKIKMDFDLTDSLSSVYEQYSKKTGIELNSFVFMAHSMTIPKDQKLIDIMNSTEKLEKKMKITVFPINIDSNEKVIEQSKEVICPKCFEQCRIKIEDYLIKLYECKYNHITTMKLEEFIESQKIDLNKIKCDICKKKSFANSHTFYYCQNCKMNICILNTIITGKVLVHIMLTKIFVKL